MSLPVNTTTGEVIDTSAAERRALKISLRLDSIADGYEAVVPMIREALELRDHETLGYRSPGEYLRERFGQALARLPQGARRDAVAAIDAVQPVSTRALAPVFGVSNYTVHKDREANAGVSDLTPHNPATGEVHDDHPSDATTGGEATPPADQSVAAGAGVEEPGEAVEATSPIAPPARPAVTGLDGKTYTRPEPRAPKRRSLVDDARDAGQELRKALDRVERIAADDRLARNKDEVAAHLRHHLDRAQEVCQDLSELINN